MKPTDFKQGDARWGTVAYAVDGESSTIKSAGCGPTVLADILNTLCSSYIDPLTCASWARMHNYKVYKSGTSYNFPEAMGREYDVSIKRLNKSSVYGKVTDPVHALVLEELKKGNWIIACMGKGNWTTSGHYILAYEYKDGYVSICDPASSKARRLRNTFTLFSSQAKYYWVVGVPTTAAQGRPYMHDDFIREVQFCLKAKPDGIAGPQTLSSTITVSMYKNRKHPVVLPLQKYLKRHRYYGGDLDCIAGTGFDAAVKKYQGTELKYAKPDGKLTARGKTWKSVLGIK